jgi:hypothetical protein
MSESKRTAAIGPALLEYLRNLTPQILLLALSLVAWIRVDTNKSDYSWNGIQTVLTPALLFGVFLIAFFSNTLQLIERAVSASEAVDIEVTRLARRDIPLHKKFFGLIPVIWRHDRMFAVRATIAIVVVLVGSVTLFAAAVPQAVGLLRIAGV